MEIRKTARLKKTKVKYKKNVYSEIVAIYDTNVDTQVSSHDNDDDDDDEVCLALGKYSGFVNCSITGITVHKCIYVVGHMPIQRKHFVVEFLNSTCFAEKHLD